MPQIVYKIKFLCYNISIKIKENCYEKSGTGKSKEN